MKIVADERIPFVKDYFANLGELVLKPGREMSAHDMKNADVLLVRSITNVDKALLGDSTVKFVGSITAGKDHLDEVWLEEADISCYNAHGFNAPAVADYIVSAVAALQRKQILESSMKRAAVIGVGSVGSLVVERLKLLGFDVIVCDPLRAAAEPNFQSTPFDEIADVDLITFHVPLTSNVDYPTKHMINAEFLKRQKPGAVLINTSRGGIIQEDDLEQYGKHLFWCFDVWPHEPNISKSLLERAILATPHIAGYTIESKRRGTVMLYDALCKEKDLNAPKQMDDLPKHQITFAGDIHFWQDVVLGVYNPVIATAMMRSTLLPAENLATLFDEMRHQFTFRHELAYSTVVNLNIPNDDKYILRHLGVGL